MRGTVAKRLRNQARATSAPTEQKQKWFKRVFIGKDGQKKDRLTCTVRNVGFRAEYQKLKKAYKSSR